MNFHRNLGRINKPLVKGLGTKILSSGIYLPSKKAKSVDIFKSFDSETKYGIPFDWMNANMGIIERRMCEMDAKPSDLAIPAAEQAIANYAGSVDNIDAVIFCGIERDRPEPATAHEIQKKLGLNSNYAFDVGNACFGFFDGLRVASSLIQSKAARSVLVVTAEVPTKLTRLAIDKLNKGMDKKEMMDIIGFLSVGDAGAAMIIGDSGDSGMTGFTSFEAETLSQHNDLCSYEIKQGNDLNATMKMARIVTRSYNLQKKIFKQSVDNKTWDQPKFLLTHQVGKKAFEQVASLGVVPVERMIKSYDYLGNATSANLALNYHQLMETQVVQPFDVVRACYNGSGIVAGQLSFRA